jgi:hypothetical protein
MHTNGGSMTILNDAAVTDGVTTVKYESNSTLSEFVSFVCSSESSPSSRSQQVRLGLNH